MRYVACGPHLYHVSLHARVCGGGRPESELAKPGREEGPGLNLPPVRAISKTILLMKQFRVNAILIVPEAMTTNWWIKVNSLTEAKVEGPVAFERSTDICIPSRRVPVGTVNSALLKLRAFKIT
jgi:hypothetical protein